MLTENLLRLAYAAAGMGLVWLVFSRYSRVHHTWCRHCRARHGRRGQR